MPSLNGKISVLFVLLIEVAIDMVLYWRGISWTPLHYESLLPLVLYGHIRWLKLKLTLILVITTIAKLLFFEFGLSLPLIFESNVAVLAVSASMLTFIYIYFLETWNIKNGLIVLGMGLMIAWYFDKHLTNDMGVASFLLPQSGVGVTAERSDNSVYAELLQRAQHKQGTVLVIWESLGVPTDEVLLSDFRKQIEPYQVLSLLHEGGSTVSAEIRYLCGWNHGLPNSNLCTPHIQGSEAFHGNSISYFNRRSLYTRMGFTNFSGRSEMETLPVCHFAYNAVCDRALLKHMLDGVLANGCHNLSYALTIDSHFPYLKYKQHGRELLMDVKWLLNEFEVIKKVTPDCELIIVGDHPPPLASGFLPHSILEIKM